MTLTIEQEFYFSVGDCSCNPPNNKHCTIVECDGNPDKECEQYCEGLVDMCLAFRELLFRSEDGFVVRCDECLKAQKDAGK